MPPVEKGLAPASAHHHVIRSPIADRASKKMLICVTPLRSESPRYETDGAEFRLAPLVVLKSFGLRSDSLDYMQQLLRATEAGVRVSSCVQEGREGRVVAPVGGAAGCVCTSS